MNAVLVARRLRRRWAPSVPSIVGVAVVVPVLGAFAWGTGATSGEVSYGLIVALVLGIGSLPILLALVSREEDPRLAWLIIGAFYLKLFAAVARYAVAFDVYDGTADAGYYHDVGSEVYEFYRQGIFDVALPRGIPGTGFVMLLTGLIYAVTGPTALGGFFVNAWLGFWGLYLFYRAFRLACPQGSQVRYAVLVFLLPSLIFWPSSIGKEAWMTLGLGIVSYGAARLLTRQRGGFLVLVLGVATTSLVRPHVAAIAAIGVFIGYALRPRPADASIITPLLKIMGVAVIGLAVVVAATEAQDLIGVEDLNVSSVESAREDVAEQTSLGGSVISGESSDEAAAGETDTTGTAGFSPTHFPQATMQVLFQPFPWQASNLQAGIAAAEGALVLLLFLFSWRRIVGAIRAMRTNSYLIVCAVYACLFIYGFSAFNNFGILVRQRVQVLPFVLVFLAMPAWYREADPRRHPPNRETERPPAYR